MYASKIEIKREPQFISYEKIFDLGYDATLSISDLRFFGITDENTFATHQEENTKRYTLYVNGMRLETEEETKIRVAKEEAYMRGYEEYHKNKNKKTETK
jgi:hypothetical protein